MTYGDLLWRESKYTNAINAVFAIPKETNAKEILLMVPTHKMTDKEKADYFYEYGYATAMNTVIQAIERELGNG